ncbi:hypothetical protein HG530_002406 [Fusarium avenaceum]|nr:hypothetical protein HG530_002406 [Fusarium avenaceum]
MGKRSDNIALTNGATENPPEPFSRSDLALFLVALGGVGIASLGAGRVSSSGEPDEPLDRGRGRAGDSWRRGVVGVGAAGEGVLGDGTGDGATSDQWADDQYKQRIEKWASITRRCNGDPKSFVYVIVGFVSFIKPFVTQRRIHRIFLVLSQNLKEELFLVRHGVVVACAMTNKRSLGQQLRGSTGCENRRDGDIVNFWTMCEHLNKRTAFLIITNDNSESTSSLSPHDLVEKTATTPHEECDLAVDFSVVVRRRNMARGGVTVAGVGDDNSASLGVRIRVGFGTRNRRDSSPQSLMQSNRLSPLVPSWGVAAAQFAGAVYESVFCETTAHPQLTT